MKENPDTFLSRVNLEWKFLLSSFLPFLLAVAVPLAAPARAASQAECAIWLCLPGGFPAGCGDAHAAMIQRIKNFKPPLPPFGACAVDGGANTADIGYRQGYELFYCNAPWTLGSRGADFESVQICIRKRDDCPSWQRDERSLKCPDEIMAALRRAKPNWIDFYENGEQFFRRVWW